jgi:RNA polymerase sigma-70 factor, ECF subfamily
MLNPASRSPRAQAFESSLPSGLPEPVSRLAASAAVADAELVRRTLTGEADAFAALVARYQKRAFWVAFHVVGRIEDARDITQEAFVRLYRSLDRYDYARSFYTWFYRIVMNLAIDHHRKHRHDPAASLEDFQGGLPDESAPTEIAPIEATEQTHQGWRVLERLDSKFRTVLVLRDIHGLSCREIAPILRITHATVRWRLHRGRQIFRDCWERIVGGAE